jgi:hypothetical protein
VTHLGRNAEATAHDHTALHDPATDTGAHGQRDQVALSAARAEASLTPGGRIGVVLHDHREAGELLELPT